VADEYLDELNAYGLGVENWDSGLGFDLLAAI